MQYFVKVFIILFLILTFACQAYAQTWMAGYAYRKKITFDKSKIEGNTPAGPTGVESDIADFPVLLELQDEAFKYQTASACEGSTPDKEGRTVAFAAAAAPAVKLRFQIESYDPLTGKYRCWVKIPHLSSAKSTSPPTEIYFYYGGFVLHDSYSEAGLQTWNESYIGVWHMNGEHPDLGSDNVKTGVPAERLTAQGLTAVDKIAGKVGDALQLDGQSKYLRTAGHTFTSFTLSGWIKWNGGTQAQTIMANDSINPGRTGWQLKINSMGRMELITYRSASLSYVHSSSYTMLPGQWYHVACNFVGGGVSHSAAFYVNGVAAGGVSGGVRLAPSSGYISVGRSKDGTLYFNGAIDGLRLYREVKLHYWLKNEYQNQNEPASFYTVGPEETHSSWAVFTGVAGSLWESEANWLNARKPVPGDKIRIQAGKTARISGGDVVCGALVVEAGATLSCNANLRLNCDVKLGAGALLQIDEEKKLTLAGDGLRVSGTGVVTTAMLEINGASSASEMELDAELRVSKGLNLVQGRLNANGRLWLLASAQRSAALLPVLNPATARISGLVHVQSFVNGAFPAPSSGRGWRLWCSPVVHGNNQYHLLSVKDQVFVTGQGGAANGFDASPNNGATIYTHDQSLPGVLKDKFVAIPDLNHTVPLGRGFYIFLRGSRLVEHAYRDQIELQPFVNPGPFVLTHTGNLHLGPLTVETPNRNVGEEGDGFHLLGNPYASPVRWGSLGKEKVGPFVWLYDPLNQSYLVSDNPETIIPSGAGFFVRVLSGESAGRVTFTEASKVLGF